MDLREQLIDGCRQLGLPVSDAQVDALLHYQAMMVKWNKVYNLTAITDPSLMVSHHLLDSLAVLSYLHGERIIDVGCGGGLPGIVLAIMAPDKSFVLLDSNNKKTRFVTQAMIELKLNNVKVQNARVEQYQPEQLFDTVISRAFASLADMLTWCDHLRVDTGLFLAMKGLRPDDELAQISAGFHVVKQSQLVVPGLDAERHVVLIDSNKVI